MIPPMKMGGIFAAPLFARVQKKRVIASQCAHWRGNLLQVVERVAEIATSLRSSQ